MSLKYVESVRKAVQAWNPMKSINLPQTEKKRNSLLHMETRNQRALDFLLATLYSS